MRGCAPRTPEDSVRPRLQSGVSARLVTFTVRFASSYA